MSYPSSTIIILLCCVLLIWDRLLLKNLWLSLWLLVCASSSLVNIEPWIQWFPVVVEWKNGWVWVCLCASILNCARFFATPWTIVAHQAPLSMEFSRQERWRGSSWLRDPTSISCTGTPILYHCAPWEASQSMSDLKSTLLTRLSCLLMESTHFSFVIQCG